FIPEFVPGSTPEQPDQTTWVLLPLRPPTTTLKDALTESATTLEVASATGFPTGGKFSVVIGGERVTVERVHDRTPTGWVVTRGAEGTTPAAHDAQATVSDTRTSGVRFYLGIDGLNVWLVLLTAVLMLPCVLVSFESIKDRVNEYYAWLLALQTT